MIESVLKEVKEAEKRADELQKEAYKRGKELVLEAEAEAERQKKLTVSGCKAARQKALQEDRRIADERSQTFIKKGAESADAFVDDKNSAATDAADRVVEALLAKYIKE